MKRKNLKLFTIFIAIAMMIMAVMPVSRAAEPLKESTTGKITVSDLEAGATVKLYKLTKVEYDDVAGSPKDNPYTWVVNDTVKNWINTKYPQYSNPENFNSTSVNAADAAKFYDGLASTINGTVAKYQKTAGGTASYPVVPDKSVEFTGCEMGTYLAVIENGYRVYRPSVVNLTPEYNTGAHMWELKDTTVEIKSTEPQIKQTVTDDTKTKDNYATDEEITFTIIADIPTYPDNSLAKKYEISDILGEGLKLEGDISVFGISHADSSTKLTSGYEETKGADKKSFALDFTYEDISSYKQIKVVYKAKLDKGTSTVLGKDANKSNAILTYSNNPYVANSETTQESLNKVFTYGIELTKEDKAKATKKLPGAEFKLSKDGAELKFTKVGDIYYVSSNGADILTTGTDGLLKIYGLDEGTYSLKETKAPEGYNIPRDPVEIVISDTKNGEIDGLLEGETQDKAKTGIYKLTVKNSEGFQLPVTGGLGTTLFVAGGIVFVGIGIWLFAIAIKSRKK